MEVYVFIVVAENQHHGSYLSVFGTLIIFALARAQTTQQHPTCTNPDENTRGMSSHTSTHHHHSSVLPSNTKIVYNAIILRHYHVHSRE